MANEYPAYNGVAPSWAEGSVTIRGSGIALIELADIKSIKTNSTVEVDFTKRGNRIYKRTTGSEKPEGSWELYADGFHKLIRGIKSVAPFRGDRRQISKVVFDIIYQRAYEEQDEIYETQLLGCRILSRDVSGAEGTTADVVPMNLSPMEIVDIVDGEPCVLL